MNPRKNHSKEPASTHPSILACPEGRPSRTVSYKAVPSGVWVHLKVEGRHECIRNRLLKQVAVATLALHTARHKEGHASVHFKVVAQTQENDGPFPRGGCLTIQAEKKGSVHTQLGSRLTKGLNTEQRIL